MNKNNQIQAESVTSNPQTLLPEAYFHRVTVLLRPSGIKLRLQCFFEDAANEVLEILCGFYVDEPWARLLPDKTLEGGRVKRPVIGTSQQFTIPDGTLVCRTFHTPRSDGEFRNDIELELPLSELDKALELKSILWPSTQIYCKVCALLRDESVTTAFPYHLVLEKYKRNSRALIVSEAKPTQEKRWWQRRTRTPEIF